MKRVFLFLILCASAFGQAIPDAVGVYNLSASGGGGGGSGTVTSVSFTGGLITVSSPTTAASLTVAGTSGGIPYFNSNSTWASTSLLAANSLMIGGGAGTAPSTVTTGTGILTALGINVGTAGAPVINGGVLGTPSSGTITNFTGTASININGTVGATTPAAGTFTTLGATGAVTLTAAVPQLVLGANTTTKGGIKMFGNTSGDATISPLAVAGTATALTLPAVSGGLVASVTAIGTVTGTPSSSNFLRGDGTWATPSGSGTVTVVSAGSLTSTALVTGGGTTTLQTPSATATMDSSGNISTPGTITVGNAATTAGAVVLTQGTTQSTGTTNITIQAPTGVTSYVRTLPTAVGSTGFLLETVASTTQTESLVAPTGTGSVVLSASPTLTGTIGAASLTLSSLTSGRATYAGASGLLSDEAAYTYNAATNILTVGGITLGAGSEASSIGPLVDSVDGTTPLNKIYQTVASGTAYTLTATSAAVTFGTTSPTITLANAGTYWISCDVQFNYVGATFAANRQFDLKLRRTNNTAADVTGSAFSEFVPVLTTITDSGPHSHIGPFLYTTANTTDSVTVFADISVLPTAGTVTVTAATIVAMRAF